MVCPEISYTQFVAIFMRQMIMNHWIGFRIAQKELIEY